MSQQFAPTESQQYSQTGTGQQTAGQQTGRGGQSTAMGGTQQSGSIAAPTGQRFQTRSFLSEGVRDSSIGLLNQCLVDLTMVNMQLKDAHWNVKGREFYQLHELFEDLVDTFEPHIDQVAERITALGGRAEGTPHDIVQRSTVRPLPKDTVECQALLAALADRMATLDAAIHQQIMTADQQDDMDTADLLNEVSRDVSKALWFVEAHLQGPGQAGTMGGTTGQQTGGGMSGFQSAQFGGRSRTTDSQ